MYSSSINAETIQRLDGLFAREQDIARVRACREDGQAAAALVPLLDALCACGICVVSKGAIEDYYPQPTPASGPKAERALGAARLVDSKECGLALSQPLVAGRPPELVEVFEELFRGL